MRAMDVMTTQVITVGPDTSVQDLAMLLSQRGISGAPVIDSDNRLVGIVSEGDLLHRAETGTERRTEHRRARWLDSFASDRDLARDYVKSHGGKVRDVMTRNVVTVSDTAELADTQNNASPCFATASLSASSAGRTSCGPWPRHPAGRPATATIAACAPSCSPSSAGSNGRMSGRRTSSFATRSCISGSPTISPKSSGRRYALRPRTSPGFARSNSTSCRRRWCGVLEPVSLDRIVLFSPAGGPIETCRLRVDVRMPHN